jgi:hypothetical protein
MRPLIRWSAALWPLRYALSKVAPVLSQHGQLTYHSGSISAAVSLSALGPCYLSPRTLNRCPLCAGRDILATFPHPPHCLLLDVCL